MPAPSGGQSRLLPGLAWAPVLLFLLAIAALKVDEPTTAFEHAYLLLLLNVVFSLMASAVVIALLARSFATRGTADRLLFGCGLSAWALAGLVAVATGLVGAGGHDNRVITIHNLCVWLAGAGQVAGAVLAVRPGPLIRRTGLWLTLGHAAVVALVGIVVIVSVAGFVPPFFVTGRGGTMLRDLVLGSASAMFAGASALIVWSRAARSSGREDRPGASSFESWYAAGLALIAVGLVGVMLQTVHGGPLGWVGRSAQFLSGVYFVVAVTVAVRQSRLWGAPLVLAAREAAERYQRLFDASSDGIWIQGPDGRVQEVNDAYCRMSGYSRDELVGTPVGELEAGDRPDEVAARLREVLQAGGHDRFESRHRRKDGSIFDVDVTAVYLRVADGRIAVSVRDVTDRKRAEEALRASEERYRSLFETMSEGFAVHEVLTDEEGRPCDYRFLRVNPAFERLTGLAAADLIGRRVLEVLPGIEPLWIERYGRVALTGAPARFESYAADLGRWYEVFAFRPAPGQFAVVFSEISARKEAEQALRDAHARADAGDCMLRALMEHVPEGITIADPAGNLVMVSHRGEEMLGGRHGGMSIEEVVGHWAVYRADGATPMAAAELPLARALRGEVVQDVELVQASSDGRKLPLLCSAAPIRARDGTVVGGIVAWRDIADRMRAEEALRVLNAELERRVAERTVELAGAAEKVRAERQRFLDVLETLPVMVTLIRPDFHVPFANRAYREALGEARGRACYAYQFGRDSPCAECQAFTPLQTGRPHHWEWTLPTGRTFEIHNFPFTDADGSPMILEMDIDITERRRAERELRAAHEELAARAEQLRRLTGELTLVEQRERRRLAKVLHDHLQQLLVGARFRTSVLSRIGDSRVARSAGEIETLLEEALAASRSLTAELSPPVLHEGGLAAGLGWLSRWMADKHGLSVELSVEEPPVPLVDDVKVLLFESVRELLFNAVKHARSRTVQLGVKTLDGGMLRVTVSDSGPGFDPTALTQLGDGGGLGLFSIRERLALIGGRVEIDSAPGRGSRITLAVPFGGALAPAAAPPLASPVPEPAPVRPAHPVPGPGERTRIRVLLADDHAVVREGVARLLAGEPDVEVVGQAADGHEAVRLARALRPDVVLMDVSMPGLDGVAATRAIHEDLPDVRVVGLSMFEEADEAEAMREAGAVDYVTKSAPASELVAAVRGRKPARSRKETAPVR
jgi:PAS domain S-box-containing protein